MTNEEKLDFYWKQDRALLLELTALRRGIYDEIINHKETPAGGCCLPDTDTMEMYVEMLRSIDSKIAYNNEKIKELSDSLGISTEIYEGDGYNG